MSALSDWEHELGKAQTVQEIEQCAFGIHWDYNLNDASRAWLFENRLNTVTPPDEYPLWDALQEALVAVGE